MTTAVAVYMLTRPRFSLDEDHILTYFPFMCHTQETVGAALDGEGAQRPPPTTNAYDESADVPDTEKTPQTTAQIFECPTGPHLLRDVVKLPCGQTLCKTCLPASYRRAGIEKTWPGTPDRIEGFKCPCCGLEHPRGDCWPDYLSNTTLKKVKELLGFLAWAGEAEELVAAFDALKIAQTSSPVDTSARLFDLNETPPDGSYDKMESLLRREMDCAICCALLYQPWTTPCGHTFCQHCITSALAHSPLCPTCRTRLTTHQLDTRVSPPNEFIKRVTTYFWADDLVLRKETIQTESFYPALDDTGLNTPLFVCTTSMPRMPTFLHVFEPKYRAMIERVWGNGNGGRHFGMVAPDRESDYGIAAVGVHLRIDSLAMLVDGRSFMETMGTSRFRIRRHGLHPRGFIVADVEDFDDVSLYEEENREAAEVGAVAVATDADGGEQEGVRAQPLSSSPGGSQHNPVLRPTTHDTLRYMTTRELMDYAYASIREMEQSSPAWLSRRVIHIYGECPNDPLLFPWWLGSILPTDESLKVNLLAQTTVRDRMKMCCGWILDRKADRERSSW